MIHGTHTQEYTTAPALVSLALAKAHLKVDSTAEDTLIQSYIDAATQWCEMYIQRSLCVSKITMYYQYPDADNFRNSQGHADFMLMYPADCNKSIDITTTTAPKVTAPKDVTVNSLPKILIRRPARSPLDWR